MTKKEKDCFWELCRINQRGNEKLGSLLETAATPEVLGYLFFNRMAGVGYHVLAQNKLLSKTSREFRNSLAGAYQQNIEKNNSFYQCIAMLSDILRPCKEKYAMLKGAVLCGYYPKGCRTANDVDLLTAPESVSSLEALLVKAGFRKGSIKNGEFSPASRRELIESRMLQRETVPYIKEVNLPSLRFFEVDIHFSLDHKNSAARALQTMLDRTKELFVRGVPVRTLADYDFFIHLCCRLYREAATYPWVQLQRDMTLYKYSDIAVLLKSLPMEEAYDLFSRAEELHLQTICACVIVWCSMLYPEDLSQMGKYAKSVLGENVKLLREVTDPATRTLYYYPNKTMRERFFCKNRCALLKGNR